MLNSANNVTAGTEAIGNGAVQLDTPMLIEPVHWAGYDGR